MKTSLGVRHRYTQYDIDREYAVLLHEMQRTFSFASTQPLFETTADADELFEAYLEAMPEEWRQYHRCSACREFFRTVGDLVTIDPNTGRTVSAVWPANVTGFYAAPVEAVRKAVHRAHARMPFYSSSTVHGSPEKGGWTHFHVRPAKAGVYSSRLQTSWQRAAEKHQNYISVYQALNDFSIDTVRQAVTLLKTDSLYRSEKVLGAAEWLLDLHEKREAVGGVLKRHVVMRAVSAAPDGFCHPRSSMIGSLLEDLQSGMSIDRVKQRFAAKMNPMAYLRPQAAPKSGAIDQAEKLFDQLGLAPALRRRFARLDEIEAMWLPKPSVPEPTVGGTFAVLRQAPPSKALDLGTETMTWVKFVRDVLPEALSIELDVPYRGNFTAITTAADMGAPPILRWDSDDPTRRNPCCVYVYNGGSGARQWGLNGTSTVTAICRRPEKWNGRDFKDETDGAVLVLEGAVDSRDSGLALFPETLSSELHGVRSVIEAYSAQGRIEGRDEASACGILLGAKSTIGLTLKAHAVGWTRTIRLDRWE